MAVIVATSVLGSGCSFLLTKGVDDSVGSPPRHYDRHCTTSKAPVVIDSLLSITNSIFAARYEQFGDDNQYNVLWGGLFGSIMYATSAVFGHLRTSSCSEHRETWAELHPESPDEDVPYQPIVQPVYIGAPPVSNDPEVGQEGGTCFEGVTCATGLSCASKMCVRLPTGLDPSAGREGKACRADSTCDVGLVCASKLCVKLPR